MDRIAAGGELHQDHGSKIDEVDIVAGGDARHEQGSDNLQGELVRRGSPIEDVEDTILELVDGEVGAGKVH